MGGSRSAIETRRGRIGRSRRPNRSSLTGTWWQSRQNHRVGSRPPATRGEGLDRGGGDAASHCLRFALSASPSGLAGLRSGSGPQHGKELVREEKKGDTSNEVNQGTFLTRLDIA